MDLKKFIIPASFTIAASSFISRILGLIRDRLLAAEFGATREMVGHFSELDTYYAAFRLPDFIYQLLIMGTVSAVFIPIFTGIIKRNKEEAWKLANITLNAVLLILSGLLLFAFVFAPYIIKYFTIGFSPEALKITVTLTRIMLLSPLVFGISALVGSILNSFKAFLAFSLAPIFYNLGIIFGIIFLVDRFSIYGVAMGVVLGSVLHLLVQLPALYKYGFRYQAVLDFRNSELLKMSKLALPRIGALAANQVNLIVDTIIASTLIAGSITILNWSQNLQFFPVSLIGISIAISHFPIFSEYAALNKNREFAIKLSQTIRVILFLTIPATAGMLLLRTEIVRLVYGAGKFNWTDTVLTADTLGFFVISLFAQALIPVITRSFYAKHNTKIPLVISSMTVLLNIILSLFFTQVLHLGVMGLAISFSIASIFDMTMLIFTLQTKLKVILDNQNIIYSIVKICFTTLVMAAFVQIAKDFFGSMFGELDTFFKVVFKTVGSATTGIIAYSVLTKIFRCQEVGEMLAMWRRS